MHMHISKHIIAFANPVNISWNFYTKALISLAFGSHCLKHPKIDHFTFTNYVTVSPMQKLHILLLILFALLPGRFRPSFSLGESVWSSSTKITSSCIQISMQSIQEIQYCAFVLQIPTPTNFAQCIHAAVWFSLAFLLVRILPVSLCFSGSWQVSLSF